MDTESSNVAIHEHYICVCLVFLYKAVLCTAGCSVESVAGTCSASMYICMNNMLYILAPVITRRLVTLARRSTLR